MRPLKLTMTAFGPYAGVEIIDFTKLKDKNIFLVTGPTGAGKTTIFDGISYAVFGSASSDERDGESLRSHFAADDMITSVELEFELKGKRYRILRIPKQQKKKARGDGFTEQKSEAYFEFLADDSEKRVDYASGVSSVNEKITKILGINCDQFRQIMMIPQGEFRKLITADSQEREKILQKIFGTEGFRRVQERLGDIAKGLYSDAKEYCSRIDENIHNLDTTENESLRELINAPDMDRDHIEEEIAKDIENDLKLENELNEKIEEVEKAILNKNREIFSAKESNSKFKYKYEIEARKKDLEKRLPEVELKAKRLVKARKALNLSGIEDNFENKINTVKTKENEAAQALELLYKAENGLKTADEKLKSQDENEPLRKKLLKEQTLLQGFRDKVKALENKTISVEKLKKRSEELEELSKQKKAEVEINKKNIKRLNEEMQKSASAKASFYELSSKLEKQNKILDKFQNLLNQNEKLNNIRNECIKGKNFHEAIKGKYDQIKLDYENLQELFFKGQAGLLSSKLVNGEPCPVCGSVNHPKPANMINGIPDETKLNLEKNKFIEAQEEYNKSSENFNRLLGEGNAQKEVLEKLKGDIEGEYFEEINALNKKDLSMYLENILSVLNVEIKRLTTEKTQMEKLMNREKSLLSDIEKLNSKTEEDEKQLEEAEKLNRDTFTKYNAEQELMLAVKKELPQGIDTWEKLEGSIKAAEKELNDLKLALDKAVNEQKNAGLEHAKAVTLKQSSDQNLKEAKDELKALEQKFKAEITLAGFASLEDYKENKLTQQQIDILEKEITAFNENLKSITDSLIKAEQEIEGLKMIEIKNLEYELLETNSQKELLAGNKTHVFVRRKQNEKILNNINELKAHLKKVEEKYRVLGDLANTARGINSEKITFERYVLAAFFDDIVNAANLRFTKITGSRYTMSRIKEKAKGNVQSGLEIEVMDNYTGRSRHIKTLSGGESFKASLSLALGLADVVQSYAGGISMDTMFIDEGFGTLDPESLDNAIQSLIDLQNTGRLVGIISHVPELKERIDARLEIIPTKEGSSTFFNV